MLEQAAALIAAASAFKLKTTNGKTQKIHTGTVAAVIESGIEKEIEHPVLAMTGSKRLMHLPCALADKAA